MVGPILGPKTNGKLTTASCSVINEKNQLTWLELGKNISKKDLEKEIAKVNPRAVNPEQTRFLTDTVLELKLPISDKAYKILEQVRDLLQQKHPAPWHS